MTLEAPERRTSPRFHIDGPMSYRQVESQDFLPGEMENFSADGALIWIDEELPLDSELVVRVEPQSPHEWQQDFLVTLLYKLSEEKNSLHGYGCRIEPA